MWDTFGSQVRVGSRKMPRTLTVMVKRLGFFSKLIFGSHVDVTVVKSSERGGGVFYRGILGWHWFGERCGTRLAPR